MRRPFTLAALPILLLLGAAPGLFAQASGEAGHPDREGCWCGTQTGVPRSYVVRGKGSDAAQKEAAADMLGEWNRFVRLFDVSVDPSPTLGSRNGVNEVNLFITREESVARYGVSFEPTTFGVAVIYPDEAFGQFNQCAQFRPEGCGPFVETDVVVNADFRFGWTADWFAKGNDERGGVALVQPTVLHEVGHTLGLHHVFDVDVDAGYGNSFSAMNYLPDDTGKLVTRMDARTVRAEYPGAAASFVDVAIFPFVYGNAAYAETYASLSKTAVRTGDRLTVSDWLVQNVGSLKAGPVRVTFTLVPSLSRPWPEPSDAVLGTVDFPDGAEDAEREMAGTPLLVPAGVPPGDYRVGAIVTVGGREDSPWVAGKPNNNRMLVGHGDVTPLRVLAGSGPTPIAADFRFAPAQPTVGEAVRFTDVSSGNPTSWSWDFGDPGSGSSNRSTEPDPSHVFEGVGIHTVTLTVRDGSAASSTSRQVVVMPRFEGGETVANLVLPVVLDLPGRYSTELTIANGGPEDATVRLRYTASPSFGGRGSGSVGPIALRSGHQLVIPDAVGSLRARGLPIPPGDQGGSLRLEFEGLSRPLDAWALARTTNAVGELGRAGVAYAGVDTRAATTGAVAVYGLRENARERSNLGLVNASTTNAVTLSVDVVPSSGASVSRLGPFTLGPGEWRQLERVLRLAGPSFTEGWAVVDPGPAPAQFLAYAVVNDNGTNDGSYVPATPEAEAESDLVVPGVVEIGDRFSSELVLANPSGRPVEVQVEFAESLAHPGGLATGLFKFPLAPFEQAIVPEIVDALRKKDPGKFPLPKGGAYAGWLRVVFLNGSRGSPGLAGARTTHPSSVPEGRFGGFGAGEGLVRHAREAFVYGLRQDASTRSNLAILNPSLSGSPVPVAVEVLDGETGLVVARQTLAPLAPMEWRQLDRVLELAPGVTNGYVHLWVTGGDGRFVAYGVLNDGALPGRGTSDGNIVEMVVIQ